MEKETIVGVYRVLYLVKEGESVRSFVTFVVSVPSNVDNVMKRFVDDPNVVLVSREAVVYFDCDDIGKVEWVKNELIEKKEGEKNA